MGSEHEKRFYQKLSVCVCVSSGKLKWLLMILDAFHELGYFETSFMDVLGLSQRHSVGCQYAFLGGWWWELAVHPKKHSSLLPRASQA